MKKPIITVLILFLLLPGLFLFTYMKGKVEARQMKKEIFSYVLENQDTLASNNPEDYQEFPYTVTGFSDAGVEYGYYYFPDDKYHFSGRAYGNGYLQYGKPNNGEDWYYYEQICKNWYYYEEHFG
ncbi:MAG: hypothetical protein Q4F17_11595 [Eubacteriales bacterium]|nr:hypothetical protein [Eubacteriales bacterium]